MATRTGMRAKLIQLLLASLFFVAPSLAAQQNPNPDSNQNPSPNQNPNPNPNPDGNQGQNSPRGKHSKSKKPQAPQQTPMIDTDEPPKAASAEEDIDVAAYYIRKGDPDAAIPRLREAIQEKPKLAKPRLMLAEIYEKRGDDRAALQCYKDYLQAVPSAPDAGKIQKKIDKLSSKPGD